MGLEACGSVLLPKESEIARFAFGLHVLGIAASKPCLCMISGKLGILE